jgi:hypothetical protein
LDAVPAADTNVLVNQHNTVFLTFEDRIIIVRGVIHIRHRTGSQTGRMFTVIARAANKCQDGIRISPSLFFDDPAVAHMVWKDTPAFLKGHG